jgi:hypothetical protein
VLLTTFSKVEVNSQQTLHLENLDVLGIWTWEKYFLHIA